MYEKPEWILFDEKEIEKLKRCYGIHVPNCGPPYSQCATR